jgi:hypothetical protein
MADIAGFMQYETSRLLHIFFYNRQLNETWGFHYDI